ncbi:60S ribosomal export protein NMD3-like [Penaeus chinensis]|uniref:60S ribosomal export protein NMD3-like n=1 Tax=Penaeus chinensis TaxID=139456 RepID=UPI001FB6111A|nr:60S ribosomal export protein NMD3-like [Penaeus chinensis]
MDYITPGAATVGVILCCDCGATIQPNPTNRCIACLRARNDISEGIPKQGNLHFCKGCERYLEPPSTWVFAPLESKELLRLCLKKLKGLSKVRLVDAGFAWTEPHSKRIKVKLSVQKEIQEGAVLQQDFIVEFLVTGQMCDDCHRVEAKDYWQAVVQVRQKTDHKRTFYYLEQLILKHRAHEKTLGIKPVHEGLDFFYSFEPYARKLLDFFSSVVPCRWTHSKKLISHDIHSNTYNYKHTFSVEIVPVCKDSVVCLPSKMAHQLGGIGQICIVHRITNVICLIDPNTAQMAEVNSSTYWKAPFRALCTSKKLIHFIVMDISEAQVKRFKGQGHISSKHQVGEVWVQRESELGTDTMLFCRTHLGHLLNPGDTVLGFDMSTSNVNDDNIDKMNADHVPDVVLVKKVYSDKATRNRRRRFKLRHLGLDDDTNSQNKDYIDFLEDLEEDQQLRHNVNIYRDTNKLQNTDTESEAGEVPRISLEEMLDDLQIEMEAAGGNDNDGEEEEMDE